MQRSTKFVENQTELEFEDQEEPKAKKNRSDDRTTIIATLDNGTLVEALKYLNYCQLAKNSLVSKKFWNLIRTNRHRLALLYVDSIRMVRVDHSSRACVQVFDKQFSSEEYNEWVIRNNYSKQIPLQGQVAGIQSIQDERKVYELCVDDLYYKDPSHRQCDDIKNVFFTCKELNHENWPLFEHFVRLITDPFIYICSLEMAYQTDVLSLLTSSISPDRNRLRCEKFKVNPEFDSQKFMGWIKDHVLCGKFQIYDSSCDEELLDFVITGASCTSEISLRYYDLSNVIFDFVQVNYC
ncbi:hypothetical protein Ddc_14464 [Ditylenchus destructor]|nr:hypothetical protein Ddc_14464 [Ditylenchus destructor]